MYVYKYMYLCMYMCMYIYSLQLAIMAIVLAGSSSKGLSRNYREPKNIWVLVASGGTLHPNCRAKGWCSEGLRFDVDCSQILKEPEGLGD